MVLKNKEHEKIMFNDRYGLTKYVIDGRKTMTRRMISNCSDIIKSSFAKSGIEDIHGYEINPKYKIGEIIAISQNYMHAGYGYSWYFEGDIPEDPEDGWRPDFCRKYGNLAGWKNKMFVRADLMPHQIKITKFHIQRLQDISDEECLKEGIFEYIIDNNKYYAYNTYNGVERTCLSKTPREAFASLIDKISCKGTWDSNPYVIAYTFELVK